MFFPLGSNLPLFKRPKVCIGLVAVFALFYILFTHADLANLKSQGLDSFQDSWSYYLALHPQEENPAWRYVSYQFVHGSLGHLLANIWYLWIFGWILENFLGAKKFLVLGLLGGALAVIPEMYLQSHRDLPIVGASGMIAFMMGSVFTLFPRAKLKMWFLLLPVGNFPTSFFIPMRFIVYVWLLMQLSGLASQVWFSDEPVAYSTHLAGFAIGMIAAVAFLKQKQVNLHEEIDLGGQDLRYFLEATKAFCEKNHSQAEGRIRYLSDRYRWHKGLQIKFFNLAIENKRQGLADFVWVNSIVGLLQLQRSREISQMLEAYWRGFSCLPPMTAEQREAFSRLTGGFAAKANKAEEASQKNKNLIN